ncbi:MAG: HAD family hydrolase [Acidobacteria bacterium]|nr:HAD family hydrolase [Acidobacteriota bacterium]
MAHIDSSRRPAVFLDRDGTINVDVGYLHAVDQLELFPWSTDALRLLKRAGFALVIVTNQSGIAQGLIAKGFVEEVHGELQRRLEMVGAAIDGYYYCPHHPMGSVEKFRGDCRCRKPNPGMIEDAARDLGLDPARSWVIGDKWIDVQLGQAVGATSILVRTGWGAFQEERRPPGQHVDAVCDNLIEATALILNDTRLEGPRGLET